MTVNKPSTPRLLSLDAFRGFTVAAMILVNYPGDYRYHYIPLEHSPWNGVTPTDLIFPFFLFIVGISIVFALNRYREAEVIPSAVYKKIFSRTAKIFLIGVFIYLYPDFNFHEIRFAGVLQRIAIVFLVCSLLFLHTKSKTLVIVSISILIIYWLAMTLIPTPGYNEVMLEPGANLAAYIDTILLPGRFWNKTWDPEGLFTTLPSIVSGISGILAGKLLLSKIEIERKIIWLFVGGFIILLLGFIWSWIFPLNKNLWTSSYVLVTSGFAAMFLAVSIFTIDVLKFHNSIIKFGIIYGSNAIAVYVFAALIYPIFYQFKFGIELAVVLNFQV
jgi:predicted acyltransferase